MIDELVQHVNNALIEKSRLSSEERVAELVKILESKTSDLDPENRLKTLQSLRERFPVVQNEGNELFRRYLRGGSSHLISKVENLDTNAVADTLLQFFDHLVKNLNETYLRMNRNQPHDKQIHTRHKNFREVLDHDEAILESFREEVRSVAGVLKEFMDLSALHLPKWAEFQDIALNPDRILEDGDTGKKEQIQKAEAFDQYYDLLNPPLKEQVDLAVLTQIAARVASRSQGNST